MGLSTPARTARPWPREWGLLHTFAPVERPTGNAVAERFIRTIKEEVIWLRDWDTAADLRETINAWLVTYHTRRAHQSLQWRLLPSTARLTLTPRPPSLPNQLTRRSMNPFPPATVS